MRVTGVTGRLIIHLTRANISVRKRTYLWKITYVSRVGYTNECISYKRVRLYVYIHRFKNVSVCYYDYNGIICFRGRRFYISTAVFFRLRNDFFSNKISILLRHTSEPLRRWRLTAGARNRISSSAAQFYRTRGVDVKNVRRCNTTTTTTTHITFLTRVTTPDSRGCRANTVSAATAAVEKIHCNDGSWYLRRTTVSVCVCAYGTRATFACYRR